MNNAAIANNFQRIGAISNSQVGHEFMEVAFCVFSYQGARLSPQFAVPMGAGAIKKPYRFALGSDEPPLLVECKSHTWTRGNNVPSAKFAVWNEVMYRFHLAPMMYRKVMFVLRDFSDRRNQTLAGYYLRHYGHLIPSGVELWEYDQMSEKAMRIH